MNVYPPQVLVGDLMPDCWGTPVMVAVAEPCPTHEASTRFLLAGPMPWRCCANSQPIEVER